MAVTRRTISKGMVAVAALAALSSGVMASTPPASSAVDSFAEWTADNLAGAIYARIYPSDGSGPEMWEGRILHMVRSVVRAMAWKRDQGRIVLDAETIGGQITLEHLIAIESDQDLPPDLRAGVRGVLSWVPGYSLAGRRGGSDEYVGFMRTHILRAMRDFQAGIA